MIATPHFPNDANGQVLKRMYDGGDDLTEARVVDFCFVFPDRRAALRFLESVDDPTVEVCLSWERALWEVTVKSYIVPEHGTITTIESTLTVKAERVGGIPDGWGCMTIPKE